MCCCIGFHAISLTHFRNGTHSPYAHTRIDDLANNGRAEESRKGSPVFNLYVSRRTINALKTVNTSVFLLLRVLTDLSDIG